MVKRIIFQKEMLLNEIMNTLENKVSVNFGIIEKIIDSEHIVIDTIEIKMHHMDDRLKDLISEITEYSMYRNGKVIIELSDLKDYISGIYNIQVTEVYDFFECNLFGEMVECIAFEMV